MPFAPDLRGAEHSTASAHVAEGALAWATRATSWDTRNTGDSATSSPRFGGRLKNVSISLENFQKGHEVSLWDFRTRINYLVTGLERHGVCLTGILRHQCVDVVDNITADWGCEDRLFMSFEVVQSLADKTILFRFMIFWVFDKIGLQVKWQFRQLRQQSLGRRRKLEGDSF